MAILPKLDLEFSADTAEDFTFIGQVAKTNPFFKSVHRAVNITKIPNTTWKELRAGYETVVENRLNTYGLYQSQEQIDHDQEILNRLQNIIDARSDGENIKKSFPKIIKIGIPAALIAMYGVYYLTDKHPTELKKTAEIAQQAKDREGTEIKIYDKAIHASILRKDLENKFAEVGDTLTNDIITSNAEKCRASPYSRYPATVMQQMTDWSDQSPYYDVSKTTVHLPSTDSHEAMDDERNIYTKLCRANYEASYKKKFGGEGDFETKYYDVTMESVSTKPDVTEKPTGDKPLSPDASKLDKAVQASSNYGLVQIKVIAKVSGGKTIFIDSETGRPFKPEKIGSTAPFQKLQFK